VDERLSKDLNVEPNAREGYQAAEWILLDYVDFVVHIFNAQRRAYYDLERLWKSAHRLTAEELLKPTSEAVQVETAETAAAAPKKRVRKTAAKKTSISVRAAAKQSGRGAAKKAAKTAVKKAAVKKTAKKTAVKKVAAKKTVKKAAKKAVKKVAKKAAKRK
jgi:ribosome-associated protein